MVKAVPVTAHGFGPVKALYHRRNLELASIPLWDWWQMQILMCLAVCLAVDNALWSAMLALDELKHLGQASGITT